MLRIHFTPDDVARVRIAAEPDPLWETVISLFRLRRPGPPLIFQRWREHALRSTRRADLEVLRPLVRGEYYPDFLTPAEGSHGLSAGVEALLATPKTRVRAEMDELARTDGPAPSWLGRLAAGEKETMERLATAIRSHHATAVAPFWPDARAHVAADRSRRARVLLDEGVEGLLRSYRPMMVWEPPVLRVDVFYEQDLHLDGRGLTLQPSYLSWSTPDVLKDTSLPPVLVYPVEHDLALSATTQAAAVAALIGRTRAAVLELAGDGRTTTELARRAGVSAAAISQHTSVLRNAHLIHTSRAGKAVVHTVTPLGRALLNAPGPGAGG